MGTLVTKVVLVLVVVIVAASCLPDAAMAAPDDSTPEQGATNHTYRPSHWSGLVRKYNAYGTSIGWKYGGGIMQCSYYKTGALCKAINVGGTYLGYYVKVGSGYGLVR